MSIPRFLSADVTSDIVQLTGDEAHHLARVRRVKAGEAVVLFDGEGHEADAVVSAIDRQGVRLEVSRRRSIPPLRPEIHLAVCLPKGPRQEWLIEKAAELGATSVRPLLAARTVVMPDNWPAKRAKWRRICVESAKQCGSAWLPAIGDPVDLPALLAEAAGREGITWMCHPSPESAAPRLDEGIGQVTAIIGPEGGFDDAEAALAVRHGARLISLGSQLLRVETAALACLAVARILAATKPL